MSRRSPGAPLGLLCTLVLTLASMPAGAIIIIIPGPRGPPPLPFHATAPRVEIVSGSGTALPETGERVGGLFSDPIINARGDVALVANIVPASSPGPGVAGLFRWNGRELEELARAGDPAGSGAIDRFFREPVLNDTGDVAVQAQLAGTPAGSGDDFGVLLTRPTGIRLVAQEGDAIPDGPGTFQSFSELVLSDTGQLAFFAGLAGTGLGTSGTDTGLYRLDGDTLTPIARSLGSSSVDLATDASGALYRNSRRFDAAGESPIVPAGLTLPFADRIQVISTVVSDDAEVALQASVYNGRTFVGSGLFRLIEGGLEVVAFQGDALPGGSMIERGIEAPAIANDGTIAFLAKTTGPGSGTRESLLVSKDSELSLAYTAPGPIASSGLSDPTVSPSGLVAFVGGGALRLTDGAEVVELVDSSGVFLRRGHDRGGMGAVNDRGQVVYREGGSVRVASPDLHWRGPATGSWDDADAWTLGIRPEEIHPVAIDPPTPTQVKGPRADTRIAALEIGSSFGSTAELHLDADVVFMVDDWIDVEEAGAVHQSAGEIVAASAVVSGAFVQSAGIARLGSLGSDGRVEIAGLVQVDEAVDTRGRLDIAQTGILESAEFLQRSGETRIEGALMLDGGVAVVTGGTIGGAGRIEGSLGIGAARLESDGLELAGDLLLDKDGELSIELGSEERELTTNALRVEGLVTLSGLLDVELAEPLRAARDRLVVNIVLGAAIELDGLEVVDRVPGSVALEVVDLAGGGQALRLALVPEPDTIFLISLAASGLAALRRRSGT